MKIFDKIKKKSTSDRMMIMTGTIFLAVIGIVLLSSGIGTAVKNAEEKRRIEAMEAEARKEVLEGVLVKTVATAELSNKAVSDEMELKAETATYYNNLYMSFADIESEQASMIERNIEEQTARENGGFNKVGIVISPAPVGENNILNLMPYYIPQKGNDNLRGDGRRLISNAGCIDCCYTMCANYFNKTELNINEISSGPAVGGYVDGQNFLTFGFLEDHQMGYSLSQEASTGDIVNHIKAGYPVILRINGPWYGNDGAEYHRDESSHFVVLFGYDSNGIYVLDPANPEYEWSSKPIPYSAFETLPLADEGTNEEIFSFVTSNNPEYVPEFVR